MAEPKVLTIELGRVEKLDQPTAFEEKRQSYFARGPYGKLSAAPFPWDEVAELRDAFREEEPPAAARRKMGALLLRFLRDVLKGTTGWGAYESALLASDGTSAPCLLRFRFSASELFSLPWAVLELDRNRSLGSIRPYPVQFEWASNHPAPAMAARSGRVLFAWAEPVGTDPVDVDAHLEALEEAGFGFDRERDVLEDVDVESLRETLQRARDEGRPFQVLHLLCHGSEESGMFGLVWNASRGSSAPEVVVGDRIRDVLAPFKEDLQVVVLSACHGGDPGRPGTTFGGVAHDIHKMGFPGVIASLMPLSVDGSVLMTRAFHEAFGARGASIREAYQAAHAALPLDTSDWASLQLFMPAPSEDVPARGERIVFDPDRPPRLPDEIAVAYEVNFNVPEGQVAEALKGHAPPAIPTVVLHPLREAAVGLPRTQSEWRRALGQAERLVAAMGPQVSRVHLLGRAPLPLMFHLGWLLKRVRVFTYQFSKSGRDGMWPCFHDSNEVVDADEPFFAPYVLPDARACVAAGNRMVMTIEVQPFIADSDLSRWLGADPPIPVMRLQMARPPSETALRRERDSARALAEFSKVLERIHVDLRTEVREISLLLACPASLAAVLGGAYSPMARATIKLFNFSPGEGYTEVPWSGGVPPRATSGS
ncbi:SAVED domain-containing protein [Myxococcus stipitatus]|uniref:SAVED domain-containing protein n=1 Tax=Myxococcus stipitatus TaxID=83455 RepID=UPI001F1C0A66|nr:SAVED domain-containing protein [Myxococcus stipitatus]MCE9668622.1 SAVED domain-containing protein [Myxococcus stipitatus]